MFIIRVLFCIVKSNSGKSCQPSPKIRIRRQTSQF